MYSTKTILKWPTFLDLDLLFLKLTDVSPPDGLVTASKREGGEISQHMNCYVLGVHTDTKLLQASDVRFLKPGRLDGERVFSHCADTYPGSSGGPLVCYINGKVRVIGINSYSAFDSGADLIVSTCDIGNINSNGSWATYIDPDLAN